MYPTSYAEALAISKTRKRKLANNTYLFIDNITDEWIGIRLHKTVVVKFFKDESVQINAGGWMTPTTKDRINCAGISVIQCLNEWYVVTKKGTFEYKSGMTIDKKGYCNTPKADIDGDRKEYRREKYKETREKRRMIRLRETPLYKVMLGLSKIEGKVDTAKIDSVIDKYNPKLPIYKPR